MKRKYFLVVLFLILAIFLSGCGMVTPAIDKIKIKATIQNYAFALNNQDWDRAKSYCVYSSDAYFMVETYEFYVNYYNVESFAFKIDEIRDIEINGNYAQAYIHTVATIGSWNEYIGLQKVNNIWKIYFNSLIIFRIKV